MLQKGPRASPDPDSVALAHQRIIASVHEQHQCIISIITANDILCSYVDDPISQVHNVILKRRLSPVGMDERSLDHESVSDQSDVELDEMRQYI